MKIRQGFVSNSSSSSFIVAFPKNVKLTKKNIHKLMFDVDSEVTIEGESSLAIVNIVHYDIQCQRNGNKKRLKGKLISSCWDDNLYVKLDAAKQTVLDKYSVILNTTDRHIILDHQPAKKEWNQCIIDYNNTLRTLAAEKYIKFLEDNPNSKIFVFEYSDNMGGIHSIMEHCDIFEKLPHIYISNH